MCIGLLVSHLVISLTLKIIFECVKPFECVEPIACVNPFEGVNTGPDDEEDDKKSKSVRNKIQRVFTTLFALLICTSGSTMVN